MPYCGAPPIPAELWSRFNLDPVLGAVLIVLAISHWRVARGGARGRAMAGWAIAVVALMSPLCALSVSLFAARVGQHMLLALVAAPLIAIALPWRTARGPWALAPMVVFALAIWAWHLPGPYDATFRSDATYWTMHATLFGSAVWLWHVLLRHPAEDSLWVFGVGAFTTVQMGLLGAILTFTQHPLFAVHYATTRVWGFDPVADQALGGLLMWVPGTLFLLIAAKRSLDKLLSSPPAAPASPDR